MNEAFFELRRKERINKIIISLYKKHCEISRHPQETGIFLVRNYFFVDQLGGITFRRVAAGKLRNVQHRGEDFLNPGGYQDPAANFGAVWSKIVFRPD